MKEREQLTKDFDWNRKFRVDEVEELEYTRRTSLKNRGGFAEVLLCGIVPQVEAYGWESDNGVFFGCLETFTFSPSKLLLSYSFNIVM